MKSIVSRVLDCSKLSWWSSLRVKNFSMMVLGAVLIMAAGCKPQAPVNPFVDPGNTPDPQWVVTVENDLTASMTAIVKVSFANQPGALAAFIGNECCGIAEFKADYGLYWLYISPNAESSDEVQLRFYSPELKRIFEANSTFPFSNYTHLGTLSDPLTPEWTAE